MLWIVLMIARISPKVTISDVCDIVLVLCFLSFFSISEYRTFGRTSLVDIFYIMYLTLANTFSFIIMGSWGTPTPLGFWSLWHIWCAKL